MVAEITNRQLEIIEAAGKILTSSGVSGLTIKNLAKEMGFSESAVYRHFTGKEKIIIAMLDYLSESMDERLRIAVNKADSPEEKLKAIFKSQFSFFEKYPYFVVAVFSDGLMDKSKPVNEAILRLMTAKMKHLMPIIMEGQQKGAFTNAITADELMHIVMGTFRLQMFKWRVANFGFDIIRSGENLIYSLLTIIKNK